MQRIRPALLLLIALAPTLSGCFRSSGDEPDFPKPIGSAGCPNVSGTYRYSPDPGSQGDLAETPFRASDFVASALTIEDESNSGAIAVILHRDRAEFEQAVAEQARTRPQEHAIWLRKVRAMFDPMTSKLLRRTAMEFDALARLGPVPERSERLPQWRCADGWYRNGYQEDHIAITRDVAGGLLVRFEQVERSVIGTWAENPSAGIPYYIHTKKRWARFAPVETPSIWHPPLPVAANEETGVPLQRDDDPRVAELRYRARKLLSKDAMLLNFKLDDDHVLFTATVENREAMQRVIDGLTKDSMVARISLQSTMDMSFGRVRFVMHVYMRSR